MNRREFASRVSMGAAAAWAGRSLNLSAVSAGRVNLRFVGMMGFIERRDGSFLVATPGRQALHHLVHVPFLMARAGSPAATAFEMTPAEGVVPAAFDTMLNGTRPDGFVFRSLENTALDVVTGTADTVRNDATELAQMNRIAPGKRVRGNIDKWAMATVSLRGGRLENSAAHPDAGRVWSFGAYSQRLTDAVNFHNPSGASTTIRLTSGSDARAFHVTPGEGADLWVFSAAFPSAENVDPTVIEHSAVMFDFLVDARPVLARCPEATGREVPPTELPFVSPSSAGLGAAASEGRMPPFSDLCWMAAILLGGRSS